VHRVGHTKAPVNKTFPFIVIHEQGCTNNELVELTWVLYIKRRDSNCPKVLVVLIGHKRSIAFLEIISGIRSLKHEQTGKEFGESINSKTYR
jgi:hypothetical protein